MGQGPRPSTPYSRARSWSRVVFRTVIFTFFMECFSSILPRFCLPRAGRACYDTLVNGPPVPCGIWCHPLPQPGRRSPPCAPTDADSPVSPLPSGKRRPPYPPAAPKKGWQFTHLTAGVFYHFAACPPEDVVYHLEYQDQKDLESEPLQSLRRRGVGLCGPVHPVLLLPQARQGHLPGGGRPSSRTPPPSWGWSAGCFGGGCSPVPLGGRGVPAPVRPHPAGGPHRGPPSLPWCWWPMGPSFSSSPGSISGCAGRFSPACLPRPTAGGGLAQKNRGIVSHRPPPRNGAGRVFPWRPAPSCIAVSKTLHFSPVFPCRFSTIFALPTVRLPLES